MAAEAERTGTDLHVDLRDIRVEPGRPRRPRAIEAGETAADAADAPATPDDDRRRAGRAGPVVQARDSGVEPLLAVQGLKKHFPIYGGMLRRQIGTVYAVDGVDFEIMPGRDVQPRRRVRLRQDDARPDRDPAHPVDRRPGRVRRLRAGRRRPRRHAAAAPPDADHLPGPVRVAEPADARLGHHRRGPARPGPHATARPATSASRTRSSSSACAASTPAATRTSSRAASASASASPVRSPSGRTSSSATGARDRGERPASRVAERCLPTATRRCLGA